MKDIKCFKCNGIGKFKYGLNCLYCGGSKIQNYKLPYRKSNWRKF